MTRSWPVSPDVKKSRHGPRIKNAKKTVVDKITFASRMEARRYIELKKLKAADIVTKIECRAGICTPTSVPEMLRCEI